MGILIYANPKDSSKERLFNEISIIPKLGPIIVHDHETFAHTLRWNVSDPKVIVFLAFDHDDLAFILSQKKLISDYRLIMILPDSNEESVSKGHSLYPRFLTCRDGGFKDVAAVLEKMLKYLYSQNNRYFENGINRNSSPGAKYLTG